jgi:cob(I)alamin adenosyltransferase
MPSLQNRLDIVQAGLDRIIYSGNMKVEDKIEVEKGWLTVKEAALSGEYQLIILDEANIAIELDLIDIEEMKDFLQNKPHDLEVVLTGRNAHKEIIELAHLVSEIHPIKHYWDIGVKAREGIEY